MNIVNAFVVVVGGVGVAAFGLLIFYAILPLFYGLLGLTVGYWLGAALAGLMPATAGWLPLVLAIAGAVGFGVAAYFLEPVRRILVGIELGLAAGFAIAQAIGLNPLLSIAAAVVGAIVFIPLALRFFDPIIIIGSALAGAAAVLDGVHLVLPRMDLVNRATILSPGNVMALLLWLVIAASGAVWQFLMLPRWRETHPAWGGSD